MSEAWFDWVDREGHLILKAGGRWDTPNVGAIDRDLRRPPPGGGSRVVVDLSEVERLDTAGAWLIYRTVRELRRAGVTAELGAVEPLYRAMLDEIGRNDRGSEDAERVQWNPVVRVLRRVGANAEGIFNEARLALGFFGMVMGSGFGVLVRPQRFRFTSFVFHMERIGLNALPIVSLISILIGNVLAYQGALQLRQFGAEIFVVNLIAVSILREIGILLTAIVVAGRSGSAFTAEIGSMIVNEEVDAMQVLGLDPLEILALPRIAAMVVMLPILVFVSDLAGLAGGMLMCWAALDISPGLYLTQLSGAINVWTFWTGMIKAPVFALLIALTGCFEGLRVGRSAASVGARTTRSVVSSIFLVIIADAVFSIFFATIGI